MRNIGAVGGLISSPLSVIRRSPGSIPAACAGPPKEHPPLAVVCLASLESGVDGEAGRNSARTLMKKTGMARLQLGEELVDLLLEFFRVLKVHNSGSMGFDDGFPIRAVEFGVEVARFDEAAHFIEYGFSVAAAETNHR